MIDLPQLLTIKEAAATIGVRPKSLHTEIRRRRLSPDVQRYATKRAFEKLNRCTISRETPREYGLSL